MPSKFDVWMNEVSRVIAKIAGLGAADLPDCDYRCWQKCDCRRMVNSDGYPGESFLMCSKCHHIAACYFDEGAII
jgi:hypothetical protein